MTRYVVVLVCLVSSLWALTTEVRPQAPEQRKTIGPMIGHVTDTTAQLWFRPHKGSKVTLAVEPSVEHPEEFLPAKESNGVVRIQLANLLPGTEYTYQFMIDGKANLKWKGSFRTADEVHKATRFRLAVTSCMKPDWKTQSPWYLLLAQKPDLHLTLGDVVYTNTTDYTKVWAGHERMRAVTEFAAVLRTIPTYAMWDDHDYGPNNSDGTQPGKAESLRAFREVWANPGAGTDEIDGAFFRFSRGDVDFFVLDGRFHRSPNSAPNDENKRMLGDEQYEWLKTGLLASKAKFKVLASGSTINSNKGDDWSRFDFSRKRLFRLIADEEINGVLYLSGDIHRSKVVVHANNEGQGSYDIVEVISSGITNSKTNSFATLDFYTHADDPTVLVRIIHGNATIPVERVLRLSDMRSENAQSKAD